MHMASGDKDMSRILAEGGRGNFLEYPNLDDREGKG
jgi:hypothetical protein